MIYKKKPYLTLKHLLRRQDWSSGIHIDIDIRWGPEFSIDSSRVSETKFFEFSTSGYVKTLVEGQMGTSLDLSYNVYLTISRVLRNDKKKMWLLVQTPGSLIGKFIVIVLDFFFFLPGTLSFVMARLKSSPCTILLHTLGKGVELLPFFFFPLALDASLFASLNCELWVGWI